MKWENEFDNLLREIGRKHRAMEAPQRLEGALLARMREKTADAERERSVAFKRFVAFKRRSLAWGLAALLALALWGGVAWRERGTKNPKRNELVRREVPSLVKQSDMPVISERVVEQAGKHPKPAEKQPGGQREMASAEGAGSLDVFVPLPTSEGLPPANQLSLVRVTLLGSDLQQYGLEAPPDAAARSLLAEFVVGEDGLPRAIRIVQ